MFTRSLACPRSSFFLVGPRGTGKSTWIRTVLSDAYVVSLLQADAMVRYERDPSRFRSEVLARPRNSWIVVDEVQRGPKLLDEVHYLTYRPRSKVKEVALPKFYWFDAGVLHAAAGGFDQPLPGDWDGVLLEHLLFNEIQSYIHYAGVKGSLGYWATPSGSEVDFVWWRGANVVAIEAKARHARAAGRDVPKALACR